jgi:hypothetical protein
MFQRIFIKKNKKNCQNYTFWHTFIKKLKKYQNQ